VIGAMRSGTTWLGKILDSHPCVVYRHEPDIKHDTAAIPWFKDPPYESHDLEAARTYLLELSEIRTIRAVGGLPIFPKSYFTKPTFALRRALLSGFKLGVRLPIMGAKLKKVPIPDLRSADNHVSVVIKSIFAFGRIGLFMAACPNLKTILIVRHPSGHVASVLRGIRMKKFEGSVPITEAMGLYKLLAELRQTRDMGIDFAAFEAMQPIERVAWHWAIINTIAIEALSNCTRARIVRYEDLCENPVHLSQSLFKFAELDWNTQTESFVRASTESSGAGGYYDLRRDPQRSAHKWREELTLEEIDQVSRIAEQSPAGRMFMKD
jgi:Sulfotransferase family